MAWHSHAINQSCPGMDVVSRIIEQERPSISMSALPQTSAQTSATTGTASAVTGSFRKTGEPDISESPLHPRRKSRRIMVGPVPVGGGAPISVQSMTNTLTANVPATLQQIAELTAAGCDDRRKLPFHKAVLNGELPYTIGGGIGQSRLCMLLLGSAHIGEVQASVWDNATREACEKAGIPLL